MNIMHCLKSTALVQKIFGIQGAAQKTRTRAVNSEDQRLTTEFLMKKINAIMSSATPAEKDTSTFTGNQAKPWVKVGSRLRAAADKGINALGSMGMRPVYESIRPFFKKIMDDAQTLAVATMERDAKKLAEFMANKDVQQQEEQVELEEELPETATPGVTGGLGEAGVEAAAQAAGEGGPPVADGTHPAPLDSGPAHGGGTLPAPAPAAETMPAVAAAEQAGEVPEGAQAAVAAASPAPGFVGFAADDFTLAAAYPARDEMALYDVASSENKHRREKKRSVVPRKEAPPQDENSSGETVPPRRTGFKTSQAAVLKEIVNGKS